MPSRNVVKEFAPDQFYHVYNRGVEKRDIFLDEQDYVVFIGLMKKYLIGEKSKHNRHAFLALSGQLDLVSYCLMPNHFHLLIYQSDKDALTRFMRRIMTGYVMYFNERYKRVGSLFQGRYKASQINADAYLHHISRYIHMNPNNYIGWPYSSLQYFLKKKPTPIWLKPGSVLELFDNSSVEYKQFLDDYVDSKAELLAIKWQLANDPEEM